MPVINALTPAVMLVVPFCSTPTFCRLAAARALRLSPVPPALLVTVKTIAAGRRAADLHLPAIHSDIAAAGVGVAVRRR